jgi:hypothetical protein
MRNIVTIDRDTPGYLCVAGTPVPIDVIAIARELNKNEQAIMAIKVIRKFSGLGLYEAKTLNDAIKRSMAEIHVNYVVYDGIDLSTI